MMKPWNLQFPALVLGTLLTFTTSPLLAQSGRYWDGYRWVYYQHQPQVIGDTGIQNAGVYWNGYQWVRRSQQNIAFDTILDPNRHVIDPGSYRWVNYTQYDGNGVLWHYRGYKWTSYGQPHSEITRTAVNLQAGGGVGYQPSQTQSYGPSPGVGYQPSQTQWRGSGRSQMGYRGYRQSSSGGAYGNWGR